MIAAGNRNFGEAYGRAGEVIAQKCGVPYLYRFELMGTQQDVDNVRKGVSEFWQRQPQNVTAGASDFHALNAMLNLYDSNGRIPRKGPTGGRSIYP